MILENQNVVQTLYDDNSRYQAYREEFAFLKLPKTIAEARRENSLERETTECVAPINNLSKYFKNKDVKPLELKPIFTPRCECCGKRREKICK